MGEILPIAIQVAALLFAVSAHESAHGWVAYRCGDPTAHELGRISLNPLRHIDPVGSLLVPVLLAVSGLPVFGWARPVPVSLARTRNPRSANLLVAAAGPLSNLLLAGLLGIVFFGVREILLTPQDAPLTSQLGLGSEALVLFLVFSVLINVILAIFNLLPIPPLDGFGILESLVPRSTYPLMAAMRRWGVLLLLLVIFSGALERILIPVQQTVVDWLGL